MSECSACRDLAVLSERLDQVTSRQDEDIGEIKREIRDVLNSLGALRAQADRWRGGLGTVLALAGVASALGAVVGLILGKH